MTTDRGRKPTEQIGEVRRSDRAYTYLPVQLELDEVECPVCRHPAIRRVAPDRIHFVYGHQFRLFPCVSVVRVLTAQEATND